MKLAHFGTFDVENYGDLLFPLILERRLSGLCDEYVHVSPTSGPPPWEDCVETVGFGRFLQEGSGVDGVVVGGGQIIRATPTPLEVYDTGGISPFLTYPGLWLGASYAAATDNLPLCWNAAGVPRNFTPIAAQLVAWAASLTDYLAVRDEASRRWLQEAGVTQTIDVVPDTAIEVCELWTEEEIAEAYANVFSRQKTSVPGRALVCHVNSRWAGEDPETIASRIDRICRRLDAAAILVAIGPSHGDGRVQRAVARRMNTNPLLVDKPQSLREVAACIARADAYLGSSLHGMITACSFGTRGMMIASGKDAKYSGFLQHFGLSSWLTESWEEAEGRVDELLGSPSGAWESIRDEAAPLLDRHWSRVRETLTHREAATKVTWRAHDKRAELGRLREIGRDRYGDIEPFLPFVAESLEINHAQFEKNRRRLAEESRKLGEARRKLRRESDKLGAERRKLAEMRRTTGGEESHALAEERRRVEEVREELRVERRDLKTANGEIALLVGWIEELGEGISALSSSRWWKTSRALSELRRKALRRPEGLTAMDHMRAVFQRFRVWREQRGSRADGSRARSQSRTRR